jgi:hypothetical protein
MDAYNPRPAATWDLEEEPMKKNWVELPRVESVKHAVGHSKEPPLQRARQAGTAEAARTKRTPTRRQAWYERPRGPGEKQKRLIGRRAARGNFRIAREADGAHRATTGRRVRYDS